MKRRFAILCLSVGLVFLTACKGSYIPSSPAGPVSQAPAAESRPPEAESQPPAPESPAPVLSLDEYNAMVSDLNRKIMEESEILIRAGLYEYNWWQSYEGDPADADLDALVDEVMAWLDENFDSNAETAAAVRDELLADYAVLVYATVDGEVSDEVADQIDALFAAYHQLYTIVTEPSGTVQEFVRMLCSCTYSITTVNADLTSSLEVTLISASQPEGLPPAFFARVTYGTAAGPLSGGRGPGAPRSPGSPALRQR